MTTKRLFVLLTVLAAGLSVIFALPASPKSQPTGVELALPDYVGLWVGKNEPVTEQEHSVLGHDTEFSRKVYEGPHGAQLYVTVVLSGQDMNTSIHRAERCLRAQGWNITDSRVVALPLDKPQNATLRVTRLHNEHAAWRKTNVDYYWFVGYNDLTASHFERTMIDVRDRLFKGYNQRWAYVSVYALIPPKASQPDADPEKETDDLVRAFIKQLAPAIHKGSIKYG
jgi:EpsI family protein